MLSLRYEVIFGQLPTDLKAVSEGFLSYSDLAKKQEAVLAEIAPSVAKNSDTQTAAVTQMDLLFMVGGYLPAGEKMSHIMPRSLGALIAQQCVRFRDLKPYMTYDLIIDLNSKEYERTGFMRVFSEGSDGLHERDFYYGHAMAEPHVRVVAQRLTDLAEGAKTVDALAELTFVRDKLRMFSTYMAEYARLPKDVFGDFRRYLVTYHDRTRNASGAFMPSVQLLELALGAPTPTYNLFLEECDRYFPEATRPIIAARRLAASKGLNVADRLRSGQLLLNKPEFAMLLEVLDAFIHFRMVHLGITKSQIPAAFSSTDNLTRKAIANQGAELQILEPEFEGSAGFDVRNVLTNSVYRLFELRQQLITIGENHGIL